MAKRIAHHPLRADRRNRAWTLARKQEGIAPEKQLALLDARLGEGVGAVKERARLAARIAAQPAKA